MEPTINDPDAQALSPEGLANQIFDAALMQFSANPREAARQVVVFLTETLVYAISATAGDEVSRKALLKSVGDTITSAPPLARKTSAPKP